MSTVSKSIADEIVAGNRYYPGDEHMPPVVKIVKYQNCFDGGDAYGLIYRGQGRDMYKETEFVRNPVTVWERS